MPRYEVVSVLFGGRFIDNNLGQGYCLEVAEKVLDKVKTLQTITFIQELGQGEKYDEE